MVLGLGDIHNKFRTKALETHSIQLLLCLILAYASCVNESLTLQLSFNSTLRPDGKAFSSAASP